MKNTADAILKWQEAHKKVLPWAALFALVFIVALNVWHNNAQTIKATPLLFLALFFCLAHAPSKPRWPSLAPFVVLGVLFAFFMTVDPLVYSPDGISRPWTLAAVPFFLVFALVGSFALCGLSQLLQGFNMRASGSGWPVTKKTWVIYFTAMLGLWLPVFLSFGPLRISADSYNIIQQAVGNYPLTDSHPVLYTLLLRLFLAIGQALGSLTAGAYLFAAAQLSFFAGVLSWSLYWLRKQGAPALYALAGLLYFTLSPVFAINGITAWKDIPFNALLLLLSLFLYTVADTGGLILQSKGGMLCFLGLCLAVCVLRGNGFYIVLLCMAGTAFLYRQHWRRWVLFFVPFLLVVQMLLGPVYAAFGITRLGGVESAALPLQQVARAVKNGAPLSDEQVAVLEKIIPVESLKEAYVSASPDPIKNHPDFDAAAFDTHFTEFMGLWGQLLKTNKQVYVDAWLLQTLGYWKVDFHGWTALTSEYELSTGIVQQDVWQQWLGIDSRTFFANRTSFLSLSLMAFMALFCGAHLVATRRARYLLFLLPMLTLWVGMMLGAPAYAEFRYMLLFSLALPVLLFVTVSPKREATGQAPLDR